MSEFDQSVAAFYSKKMAFLAGAVRHYAAGLHARTFVIADALCFLSCWVPFEQRSTLHRVFVLLCSAN